MTRPPSPSAHDDQIVDAELATSADREAVRQLIDEAQALGSVTLERVVDLAHSSGLSDREVEVLRLVAQGLSNRDIAGRLFISPRTAESHVQHIYTKIGMSTRAGAAMFAMRHDLIA